MDVLARRPAPRGTDSCGTGSICDAAVVAVVVVAVVAVARYDAAPCQSVIAVSYSD